MDRERFGRAIGVGAREAGKALWKAADAAASPSPARGAPVPASTAKPRLSATAVKRGGKRFGEAMWGPVARASGVLWLELTGVFFGLFAVTSGVWLSRNLQDFHATGVTRQHAWFAVGMLVLFGWFTVSSFSNARRRSRR